MDEKSVRKGIASGRLKESIRGGRLIDVELAKQEWTANATRPQRGKKTTLTEVQRRIGLQRERQLKLSNEQRVGRLVPRETATREAFEFARVIRENVLNIPARLSAQLAAESDPQKVFALLETELRLALGTAAGQMDVA